MDDSRLDDAQGVEFRQAAHALEADDQWRERFFQSMRTEPAVEGSAVVHAHVDQGGPTQDPQAELLRRADAGKLRTGACRGIPVAVVIREAVHAANRLEDRLPGEGQPELIRAYPCVEQFMAARYSTEGFQCTDGVHAATVDRSPAPRSALRLYVDRLPTILPSERSMSVGITVYAH